MNSKNCRERRRSLFPIPPVAYSSRVSSKKMMSNRMINQSGTIFESKKVEDGAEKMWVSTKSPAWISAKTLIEDEDDDVTIETLPVDASNSGRMSFSGSSSRFSSSENDSESTTIDTPLDAVEEPLPTPLPRPILKNRRKNEPLYIRSSKRRWFALRRSKDDIHPAKTNFKNSRAVSFGTETTEDTSCSDLSKNVCFGVVAIRTYNQTLGDNPAVTFGPPIQLDWEYKEQGEIDVTEFECSKGCRYRRNERQLRMNYYKRKHILTEEYNIDMEQLQRAKRDVNKAKFRREVTCYFLPIMKLEEALESAGRKTQRLLHRNKEQQ